MKISSVKLATIAIALLAMFAMAPMASAASFTFTLTSNNIGASGTLGTVTITDISGGVTVQISMNATGCSGGGGCLMKLNGGDIVFSTSGASITAADVVGITFTKLQTNNPGPFKLTGSVFNIHNISSGPGATGSLTFTINNITAADFTGFELHVCDAANPIQCTNNTGFAAAGPPGGPPPPIVAEPGTLGLLGTGLVGLAGLLRRRLTS